MITDTWIITSYFNPCRYKTKKLNFDIFLSNLGSLEANLLVVEMAYENDDFELDHGINVIRLRVNGFMWQKERLLNIANVNLPNSGKKVAWLDGDLLFVDRDL